MITRPAAVLRDVLVGVPDGLTPRVYAVPLIGAAIAVAPCARHGGAGTIASPSRSASDPQAVLPSASPADRPATRQARRVQKPSMEPAPTKDLDGDNLLVYEKRVPRVVSSALICSKPNTTPN